MRIMAKKTREHVLIADDEVTIRKILNLRLSRGGYICHEAGDAKEALVVLKSQPVALLFMDINMPGKTGIELLPEVLREYPDLAVVMVTAMDDSHTAIDCLKQGAYDYLTKPFNLEEAFLSAERALEKRQLILDNRDYQRHLEQKVRAQSEKIRASFLNAVKALAYALEAKDPYTSGHSQRVAEMAVATAREMGLSPEEQDKIRLAGLIHDIGKIGIPGALLNKPNRLTGEEFEEIKQHCQIGEHILSPVVEDAEVLRMVRHHHERYDGQGYPDKLAGKDIPLGAAILIVCDTYDAMTSERSYRAAMAAGRAYTEIERCKGSQFDPQVVEAFFKVKDALSCLTEQLSSQPIL